MDFPICSECRKFCDSVQRDFGYGMTEYWGAVSSHENLQWVSKCCDGDLIYELEEDDGCDELSTSSSSGECGKVSVVDDGYSGAGLLVQGTP